MYCIRCGAQNPDDGSFCRKCGAPLSPPSTTPGEVTVAANQTSGLAVASLVMGILGFTMGFPSILAIIFGGVAISQIGKDTRLEGKGMAVAGLVMGIVVLVFGLLIVALLAVVSLTAFEAESLPGA